MILSYSVFSKKSTFSCKKGLTGSLPIMCTSLSRQAALLEVSDYLGIKTLSGRHPVV
jgi:hypothetical protein